ncbi:MAG: ABC transporter ATP-binding protein [Chloroflexi bacterium]|nr:ABC transporter ATP-binding protein [Chloroflexota bacterium]
MIKINELTKQYPMGSTVVHALRGVTFDVQQGEFVALMGPSGSGKSTLMHLLGCLDTPTSGSYQLAGQDVSTLSKRDRAQVRNRQIGFVFQTFNLLARVTAVENVKLPLLYEKSDGAKSAKQKSIEALERVGLGDRMMHKPSELSGGQRQRVAIARALVTNPAIILADEPTGNLDSKTGNDIMRLLAELNGDGRTLIVVTHDPLVAAKTQRVLQMHDGLIV